MVSTVTPSHGRKAEQDSITTSLKLKNRSKMKEKSPKTIWRSQVTDSEKLWLEGSLPTLGTTLQLIQLSSSKRCSKTQETFTRATRGCFMRPTKWSKRALYKEVIAPFRSKLRLKNCMPLFKTGQFVIPGRCHRKLIRRFPAKTIRVDRDILSERSGSCFSGPSKSIRTNKPPYSKNTRISSNRPKLMKRFTRFKKNTKMKKRSFSSTQISKSD